MKKNVANEEFLFEGQQKTILSYIQNILTDNEAKSKMQMTAISGALGS